MWKKAAFSAKKRFKKAIPLIRSYTYVTIPLGVIFCFSQIAGPFFCPLPSYAMNNNPPVLGLVDVTREITTGDTRVQKTSSSHDTLGAQSPTGSEPGPSRRQTDFDLQESGPIGEARSGFSLSPRQPIPIRPIRAAPTTVSASRIERSVSIKPLSIAKRARVRMANFLRNNIQLEAETAVGFRSSRADGSKPSTRSVETQAGLYDLATNGAYLVFEGARDLGVNVLSRDATHLKFTRRFCPFLILIIGLIYH